MADVFHRLGYMERQGSGLNKIKSAYKNAENFREGMEPEFFSDRAEFTVTLKNLNYTNFKSEAKSEAKELKLSELERKLCKLLQENPEITQPEIQETLSLSRSRVQRLMKKLSDENVIIRMGSRRNGYWKNNGGIGL